MAPPGDTLLADSDIEEAFSAVYVTAIANYAGYVTARRDFDRDGVDLTIEAGDAFRPKLDVQLKASINLDDSQDQMAFFCPRRNYDLLRISTQTPRLLVVMKLPRARTDWLSISASEMVLRHCAYWMSLNGFTETENRSGVTLHVPTANRFDVAGLQALMTRSRSGSVS